MPAGTWNCDLAGACGPIALGMTRGEVEGALGSPASRIEKGDEEYEAFEDAAIQVCYDNSGNVKTFELFSPLSVSADGLKLTGLKPAAIKEKLASWELMKIPGESSILVSEKYGIAFWFDKGAVKSVRLFPTGYYDDFGLERA